MSIYEPGAHVTTPSGRGVVVRGADQFSPNILVSLDGPRPCFLHFPADEVDPDHMSPDDIRARVAHIAATGTRDDEVAHSDEDDLHRDVLAAIADGAPNAAELASEALKTREIKFARWCA